MKKLLSVLICACLLLSMTWCPCASAVEEPSDLFGDAINLLRWYAPFWDVSPEESFPVASIMQYTRSHFLTDDYGDQQITVGDYTFFATYVVPAAEFEAAAQDFFAMVNVEALRNYTSFFWDYENDTGIDDFRHYQPDRDVYLFSATGGMGDPSWYEVLGYTEDNGLYTVYSRFVSLIWGEPEGVEGEDYIRIGEDYFEITHYLQNVMSVSNGRAQFHSWKELEALPDEELIRPEKTVFETQEVTMKAELGVFPENVTITVQTPQVDALQQIQLALGEQVSDFVAYDIQASAQPDGTVQVTFAIPEGMDPEKLALFHIPEEGEPQQLEAVVDAQNGTVTVLLSHFSVYVLAQMEDAEVLFGDANNDGAVNARDARLVLRYAAGLIEEAELTFSLADFNQDGKVNARDARAILQQAADIHN